MMMDIGIGNIMVARIPYHRISNFLLRLGQRWHGIYFSTEIKVKASFNLAEFCETSAQIKDKLNKHLAITQET